MKKTIVQTHPNMILGEAKSVQIEEGTNRKYTLVKGKKFFIPEGMLVIEGVIGVADVMNENERIYPFQEYKSHIEKMQPAIDRGLYGEMFHPETMEINLERETHRVLEVELLENGDVYGKFLLLDTPHGKICQSRVKSGGMLPVSSRGYGSIDNKNVVTLDYLKTWDVVNEGGFSQALMTQSEVLTESKAKGSSYITLAFEKTNENKNDVQQEPTNVSESNSDLIEKLKQLSENFDALKGELETLKAQESKDFSDEIIDLKAELSLSILETNSNSLKNLKLFLKNEYPKFIQESVEKKNEYLNETKDFEFKSLDSMNFQITIKVDREITDTFYVHRGEFTRVNESKFGYPKLYTYKTIDGLLKTAKKLSTEESELFIRSNDGKGKKYPLNDYSIKQIKSMIIQAVNESLNETKTYKFKGNVTKIDEIDAEFIRKGIESTPDFNDMTITVKGDEKKIAKIVKSHGGTLVESVNEASWYPYTTYRFKGSTSKMHDIQKEFAINGIEYSLDLSNREFTVKGDEKKIAKIVKSHGGTLVESVNEASELAPIMVSNSDKWVIRKIKKLNLNRPSELIISFSKPQNTFTVNTVDTKDFNTIINFLDKNGVEYDVLGDVKTIRESKDLVTIYINYKGKPYPYYLKKIDATHFAMANSKEGVDIVVPSHVGQHRGEYYFNDVKSWLKGGKDIDGNVYDDVNERAPLTEKAFKYDPSIDYLEQYDLLPSEVSDIIDQYDFDGDLYKESEKTIKKLEKVGWTADYGLDGDLFDLKPIKESKRRKRVSERRRKSKIRKSRKTLREELIPNVGSIDKFMLKDLMKKNKFIQSVLGDEEKEFFLRDDVVIISGKRFQTIVTDGEQEFELFNKGRDNVKLVKPLRKARRGIITHFQKNESYKKKIKETEGEMTLPNPTETGNVKTTQPQDMGSGDAIQSYGDAISSDDKDKEAFEPHFMYKGDEKVWADTYEKHLELASKGFGHDEPMQDIEEKIDTVTIDGKKYIVKTKNRKNKDGINEPYEIYEPIKEEDVEVQPIKVEFDVQDKVETEEEEEMEEVEETEPQQINDEMDIIDILYDKINDMKVESEFDAFESTELFQKIPSQLKENWHNAPKEVKHLVEKRASILTFKNETQIQTFWKNQNEIA